MLLWEVSGGPKGVLEGLCSVSRCFSEFQAAPRAFQKYSRGSQEISGVFLGASGGPRGIQDVFQGSYRVL